MTIEQYIHNVNEKYKAGNATEHTFRGYLQNLIEELVPTVSVTNEPKRQSCGAPDYILTKKNIPIGFIEAKDIGDKDLDGAKKLGNKEQFDRYKASLNNLIFTDYLSFHLYRDGEFITKISIAEITDKGIKSLPENFASFENLIKDFTTHVGQTIKSSKKLAEMMAGKARLLSDIIGNALTSDEENQQNSTLRDQKQAFKEILIHDITPKGFADVYAQTIAYGMFAARLHDPTLDTFSRQEAAELIPKSNPFLRKLFGYIAGPDIDERIKWVVENLSEIFLACDVKKILKNYGKSTKMEDPIIHFYEDFLSEYDSKLRKARGVWYTPAPVVNFIVRAVDDILKTEFDLPQGLADTSKTKIKVEVQGKKIEQEVHKVQILDPATGTGTFLAEVVKNIHTKFEGQQGIWSNYVENHLIPRLNGFELLMASYAMAHLKLDLLLKDTGFKATKEQRLKIYLTNSLEEYHPDTGTLFANWLSSEANEANHIKRDALVMVVMGNPPYSVSSSNKSEWIQNLIADYKKDLNERKINLDDDYIKFIRYGQHYIDKNGSGILAYISNNSFIDGITHRQMRKHLLESFDKIYILDLHGSAKKKEIAPDGSADQNVFDIMQGVSINIFVKTGKKKKNDLGKVFYQEIFGKREIKYDLLWENSLKTFKWKELKSSEPSFFFVSKDFSQESNYTKGFKIDKIFNYFNSGLQTKNDALTIHFKKDELQTVLNDLNELDTTILRKKYSITSDGRDWTIDWAKKDIITTQNGTFFTIQYKPFDFRHSYFTGNSKGFIAYPRKKLTNSMLNGSIAIASLRQIAGTKDTCPIIITKHVLTDRAMYSTNGTPYLFPLYLYSENFGKEERIPNFNMEIVKQIEERLGLQFVAEKNPKDSNVYNNDDTPKHTTPSGSHTDHRSDATTTTNIRPFGSFAPIDILDYIYAVLHSPTYREKYKEFLKIDFPRVPYPKNQETFWKLVELGGKIRQIHLLESSAVTDYITQYPEDGNNVVDKPKYIPIPRNEITGELQGNVYINDNQCFANVPLRAWKFYIGGYQPAQKWLKDRKNRTLDFEDILHYQKIIVALTETDRLMKEIDQIEIE